MSLTTSATKAKVEPLPILGWRNMPTGVDVIADSRMVLRRRQFRALFTKRVLHSARHLRNVISQILLPVLFALGALAVAGVTQKSYDTAPCRLLTLDTSKATYAYSVNDTAGDYRTGAVPYINATLNEIGGRTPTPTATALTAATLGQVVGGTSLDVSGANMTAHLLDRAKDYVTNGFYTKTAGASSFEQGVFNLTAFPNVCGLERAGTTESNATLTLRTDTIHYFHLANGDDTGNSLCITTDPSNSCGSSVSGWNQQGNYYSWVTAGLTEADSFFFRCNNSQTSGNSPIVFTAQSERVTAPSTHTVLAWYSTEAIHASAESLAFAGQGVARASLGGNATFSISNCPLPQDAASTISKLQEDVTGFQIAVFMLFALTFLVASFVVFPIEERVSLAKHVQFVSGINSTTYWLANLAWDYINITISNVCVVSVFAAFSLSAYTGDSLYTVIMLLQFFGFAVLPLAYLLSRHFQSSSAGYAKLCVGFVFLTFAPLLAVMVLRLPGLGYANESRILKYVCFANPVFTVCIALYDMYTNDLFLEYCTRDATLAAECAENNIRPQSSSLSWEDHPYGGVARNCVALGLVGVIYLFVLLVVESGAWKAWTAASAPRSRSLRHAETEKEDDDVVAEREAVLSGARAHDPVVVSGLTKVCAIPQIIVHVRLHLFGCCSRAHVVRIP